jgi:hypothetical protein
LQRYWSNAREAVDASKSLLQTLVNETDAWIDDNQTSYNSALTTNNLTAVQKTLLFCAVALMRVGLGASALLGRALGVDTEA